MSRFLYHFLLSQGFLIKKGFTRRSGETRRKRGVSIKKTLRIAASPRRRVRLCCICGFMRKPFLLSCLLFSTTIFSQEATLPPIYWQNPSFEGEPQDATMPIGWLACEAMTTPDILPGVWGIYQEANDGDTYVGLITRANGTWESITQRLDRTVKTDDCYVFGLDLARGATYSGYSSPLKVRIWGSTDRCDKDQLLYESPLIEHTAWKSYQVEFTAEQPIRYIIFEAFHKEGTFRYTGNILLDNLRPLQNCPRA